MPPQPSLAAPDQLASKRRTSRACVSCRARKVRCDYLQTGNPCTTCRVDRFDCEVAPRKKRRRRVDTSRSLRTVSGSVETETNHLAGAQHAQSCSSEHIPNLQPSDRLEDGYPTLPDTAPSQTELSQHRILHQVPHYAFLVGLTQGAASEGLGPAIRRPNDDIFLRLQACQSADAAVSPSFSRALAASTCLTKLRWADLSWHISNSFTLFSLSSPNRHFSANFRLWIYIVARARAYCSYELFFSSPAG
jgi:hypothetical protein